MINRLTSKGSALFCQSLIIERTWLKQILQNLGNGETILAEVPCPARSSGSVLIQTTRTLVSLGTEKMLIDFGKGGWLSKARSQPDKVKQVLQKIKTDGLWATLDTVKAKLETPISLGYCHVGRVVEADITSRFLPGDRVISNGPHAEMVSVSENLVAKIPDDVSDDTASFAVVGAIGLQGVRLLEPTLGERVVVSGLGLIGLLSVQILRANGCQVLGIDFDAKKLDLARQFGAEIVDLSAGQDPIRAAEQWTRGDGVDAVLVTASTKSDELIHQAALMCRKRGRIVLVGVIGLNIQRADFYAKELSFQVSCSYGPGRYESNYEDRGMDYPIGFVRWTEQRNFEAVLDLMADRRIQVEPLITHRFPFDKSLEGYQAVNERGAMGIVLDYGEPDALGHKNLRSVAIGTPLKNNQGRCGVAFVGAGSFTTRMLLPLLPKDNVWRKTIVSSTGVSAAHAGKKFGFQVISTDVDEIWTDSDVNAVFITTQHNTHARLVCAGLQSGKHVFVEKPLALSQAELEDVKVAAQANPDCCLMIGFNRRFSPHTVAIKNWLAGSPAAKAIIITVNAGAIPATHWTQDPLTGGGRIIGEACHFIDLARFLAASPIELVDAKAMSKGDGRLGDCATIQLKFEDGSIATIHYLANGSKDFPKERIEVFAAGKVMLIDNFRTSRSFGSRTKFKTSSQDKGHAAELRAFVDAITNNNRNRPIPLTELLEVSCAAIDADEQIRRQIAESENG